MKVKNPVDVKTKQRTWLRHTLARHMKSSIVIPALGAALMMGDRYPSAACFLNLLEMISTYSTLTWVSFLFVLSLMVLVLN